MKTASSNQQNPKNQPQRQGQFGTILLYCVLIAGVFVFHVWKQNKYITLIQNNSALKSQYNRLKSDVGIIELDNKNLKSFERLEKLGLERFGFKFSGVPHFVYTSKTGSNEK